MSVPLGQSIRFRLIVDGTNIKAKAWTHGYTEPNTWGYTGNDASVTAVGANEVSYSSATANVALVLEEASSDG